MALFSHFTEKDIEAQGNKKYCLSLFGLQGAELEFKSTKKKKIQISKYFTNMKLKISHYFAPQT